MDIPFNVDVPDAAGKNKKQDRAEKDAKKKCLSFFAPDKKEGQAMLFQNMNLYFCFFMYGRKKKEMADGKIAEQTAVLPPGKLPHIHSSASAKIQKAFSLLSLYSDLYIA